MSIMKHGMTLFKKLVKKRTLKYQPYNLFVLTQTYLTVIISTVFQHK